MSGRVKQSDVEELKSRADLVEIVSGYVSLKPASAGSFKGLCPFHGEKSPSFNVRSAPAFYHCFGCGAGGDVLSINKFNSAGTLAGTQRIVQFISDTNNAGHINIDSGLTNQPSFAAPSDYRLKDDIQDFEYSAELIKNVKLVLL